MSAISPTKQISLLGALQEEGALKPTALKIDPDTSYAEYEEIGLMLGTLRDATAWWVGDWLLWGEGAFGEKAAQAAEVLQREPHTLATYLRVSMYVAPSRRRTNLSWTHHREVASLPPDEQKEWLKLAEDERLTAAELHARRRAISPGGGSEGRLREPNLHRLEDRAVTIYALIDPRDDGIHYIGQSTDIEGRLRNHRSRALGEGKTELEKKAREKSPFGQWWRELDAAGMEPQVKVLDRCSTEEALDREQEAIRNALNDGEPLVNQAISKCTTRLIREVVKKAKLDADGWYKIPPEIMGRLKAVATTTTEEELAA